MDHRQAYTELLRRVREAALLESCAGVLGWDERTCMPRQGSATRAEQMALLARLAHEMRTAPVLGELLAQVEGSDLLRTADGGAAANVREIRRQYDRSVRVPAELVEELARVTTRAQQVWQDARRDSDFEAFLPWLVRLVDLQRRKADAIVHKGVRYDALLDEYEPGATTEEVKALFADLRADLVSLIGALAAAPRRPRRE